MQYPLLVPSLSPRRIMKLALSIVLVGIVSFCTTASGTILYVNAEGTGDYPTIQAAIESAENGDVIELSDGLYTGNGNGDIYHEGEPGITIRSASGNPEACVIGDVPSYYSYVFSVQHSPSFDLQGVTINAAGVGVEIYFCNPVFENCIFSNCNSGVFASNSRTNPVEIINCRFINNDTGLETIDNCILSGCWFIGNSGAVYTESRGGEQRFDFCTFVGNSANYGGVIYQCERFNDAHFTNCTFYNNSASVSGAIAFMAGLPPDRIEFVNCIIANSMGSELVTDQDSGTASMSCSILYENEFGNFTGLLAGYETGYDNIVADPMFVDPGSNDFRLLPESPATPYSEPNETCPWIGAFMVEGTSTIFEDDRHLLATISPETLIEITPNPFAGSVEIRLDLSESSVSDLTQIRIFDLNGRDIRQITDVTITQNTITAVWDGTDDLHRSVSGGVYFVRAVSGSQSISQRLIHLRR